MFKLLLPEDPGVEKYMLDSCLAATQFYDFEGEFKVVCWILK